MMCIRSICSASANINPCGNHEMSQKIKAVRLLAALKNDHLG